MEQHVILVLTVTLTTPAHALLTTQDRIVTVSVYTCIVNFDQKIFQNVFSLVHWVMSQAQLVLNVFQCISVSPTIPVRMEQHVLSVLTTTLTTPALALNFFLEITVQV